jgi:hypothetical protein
MPAPRPDQEVTMSYSIQRTNGAFSNEPDMRWHVINTQTGEMVRFFYTKTEARVWVASNTARPDTHCGACYYGISSAAHSPNTVEHSVLAEFSDSRR